MQNFIAPMLLLVILFVAFGLLHRHRRVSGMCPGCTGCANKAECKNEDKK